MRLYLIRHGQSETNIQNVYAGQSQVRLTEQGESEARKAGKILAGITFDRVYASDLIRAVRTAELALPGAEIIQTKLIREYDVGSLVGQNLDAVQKQWGDVFTTARTNGDYKVFGGEDRVDINARTKTFLNMLTENPCEKVAAFTHGGTLQSILDNIMGMKVPRSVIRCDNAAVSILEYRNGVWQLCLWNYHGIS